MQLIRYAPSLFTQIEPFGVRRLVSDLVQRDLSPCLYVNRVVSICCKLALDEKATSRYF